MLIGAATLALAGQVAAQSVLLQPRVTGGMMDYALRFDDSVTPSANGGHDFRDGFKVQDRVPFAGAGLTLSRGRLFADLSGQWARSGSDHTHQLENNSIGDGVLTAGDGQDHRSDVTFRRHEYNLSLGWAATSSLSVYGGYKRSRADLVQTLTPILVPPPYVDLTGGRDGDVLFTGDYSMQFSYDGVFAGVSFAVPVGTHGALALQSSLARLSGAFAEQFHGTVAVTKASAPNQRRLVDPTFKDGEVAGRSTGLNIGIAWNGSFGRIAAEGRGAGWSYIVGVDHSQYKFDAGRSPEQWASDYEERVTRARLDVRYRFTAK